MAHLLLADSAQFLPAAQPESRLSLLTMPAQPHLGSSPGCRLLEGVPAVLPSLTSSLNSLTSHHPVYSLPAPPAYDLTSIGLRPAPLPSHPCFSCSLCPPGPLRPLTSLSIRPPCLYPPSSPWLLPSRSLPAQGLPCLWKQIQPFLDPVSSWGFSKNSLFLLSSFLSRVFGKGVLNLQAMPLTSPAAANLPWPEFTLPWLHQSAPPSFALSASGSSSRGPSSGLAPFPLSPLHLSPQEPSPLSLPLQSWAPVGSISGPLLFLFCVIHPHGLHFIWWFLWPNSLFQSLTAGDQPQLIQGIRRRDGLGDYLYAN